MNRLWSILWILIGMVVPIFGQPMRIVSLSPAVTEILATLNLTPYIVGKTSDCNYPSGLKHIQNVGSFLQINSEKIAVLSPTIIVGMGQPESPALRRFKGAGTKLLLFEDPSKISDLYNIIQQIGHATGQDTRAADVIKTLKLQVIDVVKNQPKIHPTVLIVIWHPPITSAASNTFIGDLVKHAGGNPSLGASGVRYPQIDREHMLYKNPTVIVVADPGVGASVRQDALFRLSSAAKRGYIIDTINPDLLLRPGPRFPEGLRQLQTHFKASVPR